MSKSIIQTEKECYFCGTTYDLHKHHIFYGTANRRLSEKDGCWCWLCAYHHNMSDESVHHDHMMDITLKMITQTRWEERFGTRKDFIKRYGKSWI